ncbi:unnamed protein product [Arabidopsis lyrata]|nr:unnamed protein product [Arabidopsis lyrata]
MMTRSSSSSSSNCSHLFVRHGICFTCKTKVSYVEGRAFDYLFSGLRLSHEAVSFTKQLTTLVSVYGHKKLHLLVLDLDHTLIHSMKTLNLSNAEKYLIKEEKSGSRKDLRKYNDRLVKFRPFVEEFLKEANKLFTMTAYTRGGSTYAKAVVRMLDPNKIYFGDRIITRKESPDLKTLDLVLADERGIRNLLEITSYFYFKNDHRNIMRSRLSYAERKTDESRTKRALVKLLKFLKEVHNGFFTCGLEEQLDIKDVRYLIKGPLKPHGC